MNTRAVLITGILTASFTAAAPGQQPLFPFVISYDSPQNVTNLSAWLDRPAGKQGFVRAAEGRLATDAGPIRFWATNLCFEACFPGRDQAERLARRLARLGINCVRMHHMDSRSIWGDSPNKLAIDPKKLDRLDYLIYQLKLHGVYTNINLHVSRSFGDAEGFPNSDRLPKYDKGVGNFEPRMIELQKKYARDLLAHVNPYTKTPYAREPAVAMVEISNEDALLTSFSRGHLNDLPEPYATTFRKLWNVWLREKYGSTEGLRRNWNAGQHPLGDELLRNGDFSGPLQGAWQMERDGQTGVEWSAGDSDLDRRRCLRIEVTRPGRVAWRPQLAQSSLVVEKGTPYTLTCYLRSDQQRRVGFNCMMAHDPWQRLGLSVQLDVGPDWRRYRYTFVADRDDDNARITLTGLKPGSYELAAISLRPGGIAGLAAGEQIEDDSVSVLRHGQMGTTAAARADFADFLWDTERDYWWGMHRFLEDELGVQSLISGTQLSYSPPHVQAGLDYIDAHSYWRHPRFPGRPWDRRNWTVDNVAMVNHPPGTLGSLACRRVAGKAYTVSEYNHPAPNSYAAEGFPMLAAMAALQRWDGIFTFAYSHNDDFEQRKIASFFDIRGNTPKLAHAPACAALFMRGDVSPARKTLLVPISRDAERRKLHQTLDPWSLTAGDFGISPTLSLSHALAIELDAAGPHTTQFPSASSEVFVSDTGQIRWDVSQPGGGYFTVDTPRTKLFTGFVGGRTFKLGNVSLAIGNTRLDWATVSMVAVDGQTFNSPGRILIAATGWVQNTNAELIDLGEDRVTLRDQWGDAPVLCEGIPAQVLLPVKADRVTFYPLDASGNRRAAVDCRQRNEQTVLVLGPEHKTVWYEVQIH